MIQLNKHIEILLLDNDCVIVPGLGGFMAYHVEAHVDDRDNSFLPPMRMLGFNPQLKLNDSLLVQSYIEAYDMSYPEALRRIENEVEELKQHLHNDGSYELNDIGILSRNDNGSYIFEPCEAGILTPHLYGLSSFEIKPLDNEITIEEEIEHQLAKPSLPSTYENEAAIETDEDEQENDDKVIRIKVAWIRNAVAVAAAIIAFFFVTPPISNSNNDKVALSNIGGIMLNDISADESKTVELKETDIRKAIALKDSNEESDSILAKQDTVKVETPTKKASNFCIIMASRITKKNAEKFIEQLHQNGYDKAYIYINNGIVRVAYGEYESLNEAYNDLAIIRGNKNYEQSWVFRKK